MIALEDLYILDVREFTHDLFRMGGKNSPGFSETRARTDLLIRVVDSIDVVVANGNGFSAFNYLTPIMKKPEKFVWRIKRGAPLPEGLSLVEDRRPGQEGHYMITPTEDMPLKKVSWAVGRIRNES